MFLLPWWMTIFSKYLGLDLAVRVWDGYMVFGTTYLTQVALGILNVCQNEILNGVMNTAVTLAMAVIHTESAVFPLARAVMKFEILPPGHAATIIIPIATLGIGFKIKTNKKVKKGSAKN